MRNPQSLPVLAFAALTFLLGAACFGDDGEEAPEEETPTAEATATASGTFVPGGESGAFLVRSSAWEVGGAIPAEYTCDGGDTIPPLEFVDIPEGTESLALIVEDPQAPGGTFVHWAVWNLPVADIEEGVVPVGAVQGVNGAGANAYAGPCPPSVHTYFFYAYAVDGTISLPEGSEVDALRNELEDHTLAQSEYIGTYERP